MRANKENTFNFKFLFWIRRYGMDSNVDMLRTLSLIFFSLFNCAIKSASESQSYFFFLDTVCMPQKYNQLIASVFCGFFSNFFFSHTLIFTLSPINTYFCHIDRLRWLYSLPFSSLVILPNRTMHCRTYWISLQDDSILAIIYINYVTIKMYQQLDDQNNELIQLIRSSKRRWKKVNLKRSKLCWILCYFI